MKEPAEEQIYVYVVRGKYGMAARLRSGCEEYALDLEMGSRLGDSVVESFTTKGMTSAGKIMDSCIEFSRGRMSAEVLREKVRSLETSESVSQSR